MRNLVLISIIMALSIPAYAGNHKLPFVGKKYFNFDVGLWSAQSITIKKNGYTVIDSYCTSSPTESCVDYKGQYRPIMKHREIKGLSYKIIDGKNIMQLQNGKVSYDCYNFSGDTIPCVTKLTRTP